MSRPPARPPVIRSDCACLARARAGTRRILGSPESDLRPAPALPESTPPTRLADAATPASTARSHGRAARAKPDPSGLLKVRVELVPEMRVLTNARLELRGERLRRSSNA